MAFFIGTILLAVASFVCLTACGRTGYTGVSLGEGLPTWSFNDTLYLQKPSAKEKESGLTAAYKTDKPEHADIYLYRFAKKPGETTETFGAAQAAAHKVFCNNITYDGVPTANVTYYSNEYGGDSIVRSYIFDGNDAFIKLCSVHKTERIPLGTSDYTVGMIAGYKESTNEASVFGYEKVYEYDDIYLPTVRVRCFAKDFFTAESYPAEGMPGTDKAKFETYAADGWTLEETIAFYNDNFDVNKGEVIRRNGFDMAFIGYIDNGVFYVRALLDCGDGYVMLCTEGDTEHFQHIANAMIDTLRAR